MDRPDVYNLSKVDWSLFVTLTWARERVGPGAKRKHWFSLVREIARLSGIHFSRVLWMLRTEYGEIGHLEHYHSVIGGLPHRVLKPWLCYAVQEIWEHQGQLVRRRNIRHGLIVWELLSRDCGMARVRIYDPKMNGLDYSAPDFYESGVEDRVSVDSSVKGANRYEANKFGGADVVEYSLSLIRLLGRASVASWLARAVTVQDRQSGAGEVLLPSAGEKSGFTFEGDKALAITDASLSAMQQQVSSSPIQGRKSCWRGSNTGIFVRCEAETPISIPEAAGLLPLSL